MGSALSNPKSWEEHKRVFGFEESQKPAWVGIGKDGLVKLAAAKAAGAKGAPPAGAPPAAGDVSVPGSIRTPRRRSSKGGPGFSSGGGGPGGAAPGTLGRWGRALP